MLKILLLVLLVAIIVSLGYLALSWLVGKDGKSATLTDEELDKFFDSEYNK